MPACRAAVRYGGEQRGHLLERFGQFPAGQGLVVFVEPVVGFFAGARTVAAELAGKVLAHQRVTVENIRLSGVLGVENTCSSEAFGDHSQLLLRKGLESRGDSFQWGAGTKRLNRPNLRRSVE